LVVKSAVIALGECNEILEAVLKETINTLQGGEEYLPDRADSPV